MNTPNRAALIGKLQKVLKKHYKPVLPPERTLLEHLLYACCLENSPFEKADEAFAQLQQSYFDWNEVRVTSMAELGAVFASLAQSQTAAFRLKKTLQGIFDVIYDFDLEPLKKQNLGKSVKDLEKFGATPFCIAYVTQNSLGGHAIAADEGTFDLLVVLGIITPAEAAKGLLPGIERAIPKNKGPEFFSELHQLATEFFASNNSTHVRNILSEMVPDVKDKINERLAQKKELAEIHTAQREAAATAAAAELTATKEPPKSAKTADTAKGAKEVKDVKETKDSGKEAKESKDAKEPKGKEAKAEKPPEKAKAIEKAKPTEKSKLESKKQPPKKVDAAKSTQKKRPVESGKKPVSKGLTKKKPR
jgi:endonuclease-3